MHILIKIHGTRMELNYLSFQANKVHKPKRAPTNQTAFSFVQELYSQTMSQILRESSSPFSKKGQFILELKEKRIRKMVLT